MVRRWICNLHGFVPRGGFSGMAVVLNIKYSQGKEIDDDGDDGGRLAKSTLMVIAMVKDDG